MHVFLERIIDEWMRSFLLLLPYMKMMEFEKNKNKKRIPYSTSFK